jgi:hypothetical protein
MKARHEKGEPDPRLTGKSQNANAKKKPTVNRYRLANVVFSDVLRPHVLHFGRVSNKDELTSGIKTNQKPYEMVCADYNNSAVKKEYSEVKHPVKILG